VGGRLQDRVAIVTGAGSIGPGWGNGKAIAAVFAREGARVFGVDLRLEAAEEAAAIIAGEGGNFVAHRADVSSEDDVRAMTRACLEAFGRIDVLVNNVGIVTLGGPEEVDPAEWDRVQAVNLKSMYLTARHVLPVMVRQGKGALVHISSVAAIRWTGVPYATYYATKAGMLGLSRGIALQYAKAGIRSNCVLPGLMNTPMVHAGLTAAYGREGDVEQLVRARDAQCPMGHMGDAFDVAHACLFLASDEARYVTAAELVVDGGLTAKFA
jgi:NAD(P)-dependent dehydrogenase (short-subunit alcohol dehydrogenase family)